MEGTFFKKVFESDLKLINSNVAEKELRGSSQKSRDFVQDIPKKNLIKTELSEEAVLLAEKYMEEK